jgi:pimeloyl-ACP methyl ester carboxylesterase
MKHDHLVFTVVLMASISGPLSGQESVPESRAIGTGDSLHPRWQSFEPTYREHACPFPTAGFSDRPVSCGYVLVPEDRTDADSRLISLSVAKLSAIAGPWPAQAVVFLNGGPGGATLDELGERSGTFATGLPLPESEVILFDQRGTGYSDSEFCRGIRPSSRIGVAAAELRYRAALKRCLDEARTRGIAIDAYSTWHNALDIRDLRRAMSYDEWNLWGLSYGTRLARAALDVDPEGIRSVILDSALPKHSGQHWMRWGGPARSRRAALPRSAISMIVLSQ